jgi:hypothetical protein
VLTRSRIAFLGRTDGIETAQHRTRAGDDKLRGKPRAPPLPASHNRTGELERARKLTASADIGWGRGTSRFLVVES